MPVKACFDNIKKKEPPIYCDDMVKDGKRQTICAQIQQELNEMCDLQHKNPETPIAQFSPLGKCYCCCSCFAYGTPIEVQPNLYKLVQNIQVDETVLATGPDMKAWTPRRVTELGGIAPKSRVDFMWLARFRLTDGTQRDLIASADHLFLLPPDSNSVLIGLEALRPGDQVRQADGGEATVVLTSPIQWDGGVRHIALGPYEPGESLDGHLINSNGLVTADLSVQLAYYGGNLPAAMISTDRETRPAHGSPAFYKRYDTTAYSSFLADPRQWPEGAQPCHQSLINIPVQAAAYFTQEQAADIEAAMGDQNLGNGGLISTIHYLFDVYRGFFRNLFFIVDWSNLTPNAWYFNAYDQQYAVVSGGLVRVPQLDRSGLAIVLSHLVAAAQGSKCTARADYEGVLNILRMVWVDDLFFNTFEKGYEELRATFALIDPEHRKEDPDDICRQPSISCRETTLVAAAQIRPLPKCGRPGPDFAVTEASATAEGTVVVTFNRAINICSATNPENFALTDEALAIAVEPEGEHVVLTVENLQPDSEYTVTVSNVYSETGHPLTAGHDRATFRTEPTRG